eukprot:gene8273-biopygen10637
MARAWRGLQATTGPEWRGRGAGVARTFPVPPGVWAGRALATVWHTKYIPTTNMRFLSGQNPVPARGLAITADRTVVPLHRARSNRDLTGLSEPVTPQHAELPNALARAGPAPARLAGCEECPRWVHDWSRVAHIPCTLRRGSTVTLIHRTPRRGSTVTLLHRTLRRGSTVTLLHRTLRRGSTVTLLHRTERLG